VSKNAPEFSGRQLDPQTRAVNSGSGNRPLVYCINLTNANTRKVRLTWRAGGRAVTAIGIPTYSIM